MNGSTSSTRYHCWGGYFMLEEGPFPACALYCTASLFGFLLATVVYRMASGILKTMLANCRYEIEFKMRSQTFTSRTTFCAFLFLRKSLLLRACKTINV
ncbi:hypothetical protein NC653_004485 [Populus alba x Populus x berolinensis]|uniref:Uncharacterized protein n=1 Tax=Populus alba x Populus x berolinensis TaxID=444605 RepID=A0AAD6WN11_9ROSI|nr:hypothetical protein NC653_004485 [Populus alba x Populus x berolinensis]